MALKHIAGTILRTFRMSEVAVAPAPGGDWHREGVGGLWDQLGRMQLDFMTSRGLLPHHTLLDFGCGSLRGGIHFIKYLNAGHYHGADKEPSLLEAGTSKEVIPRGLDVKAPHLYLIDHFDVTALPSDFFDYGIAQSVFTHLTPDQIRLGLRNVMPLFRPDGVFYVTFFESTDGRIDPGQPHSWRSEETDAAKYPFSFFEDVANDLGLRVEYLGDWDHPRDQKMMVFRRP